MECINRERANGKYISFHFRPFYEKNVTDENIFFQEDHSDVAIIMQGPINEVKNFTIETIKLYRKNFPNAVIIVSTWRGISNEIVCALKELNVHVILNEIPLICGSHNINYQRISTLSALKLAKELNCKYSIKTRTDLRFYSNTALSYLKLILIQYPAKYNDYVMGRIIEVGATVCLFRPWSMCDLFQFGFTSDLIRMWDFPLDNRNTSAAEFSSKPYRVIDIVNENVAEIFVHRNYCKAIGESADIDYQDYYSFIRDYFIIIDKEQIDLLWFKYGSYEYGWAGFSKYGNANVFSRMTHEQWFQLYNGKMINYELVSKYLHMFEKE